MRTTIIRDGQAVLPGKVVKADIVVRGDVIEAIIQEPQDQVKLSTWINQPDSSPNDSVTLINAAGRYVLPG